MVYLASYVSGWVVKTIVVDVEADEKILNNRKKLNMFFKEFSKYLDVYESDPDGLSLVEVDDQDSFDHINLDGWYTSDDDTISCSYGWLEDA